MGISGKLWSNYGALWGTMGKYRGIMGNHGVFRGIYVKVVVDASVFLIWFCSFLQTCQIQIFILSTMLNKPPKSTRRRPDL